MGEPECLKVFLIFFHLTCAVFPCPNLRSCALGWITPCAWGQLCTLLQREFGAVAAPSSSGWFAEGVCKGLGVQLPLLPSAEWHPFLSPLAVTAELLGSFMAMF